MHPTSNHNSAGTHKLRRTFKGSYLVVITCMGSDYGAFFPDLPGCVATGTSLDIVRERAQEALEWHISSMLEDGDDIPEATTSQFGEAPMSGSHIVEQSICTVVCNSREQV